MKLSHALPMATCRWILPGIALGTSLLLAACDRSTSPAASDATPNASPDNTAVETAIEAESPPKAASPPKPRPHRELLAMIDFSRFPKIDGATRQSHDATNASFSLNKTGDDTVQRSVQALEKFAESQGWKLAKEEGGVPWTAQGGMAYYQKDKAVLLATVGVSRGYQPGTEEVNAGLFLAGDIDLRKLPRFPGSKESSASFSSLAYTCPADFIAVRKFNREQLTPHGWTFFQAHIPGGIELPEEVRDFQQDFVQNGTAIKFYYVPKGNEVTTNVSLTVLRHDLPIPPGADLVKLQDSSPAVMSCFAEMSEPDLLAWFDDALGKSGWKRSPAQAKEQGTTRHQYARPGSRTLFLETLRSSKADVTIVRLMEQP